MLKEVYKMEVEAAEELRLTLEELKAIAEKEIIAGKFSHAKGREIVDENLRMHRGH